MIFSITGNIVQKNKQSIVVETAGGVGYEVSMTSLSVASQAIGAKVTVLTYLKVSDSDMQLFGFMTLAERQFFSLLMTVSGVGPKTALNILSLGSVTEIQSAIGRGDVKYLTAVSGLGKKTAERLVVELKGKVGIQSETSGEGESEIMADVIEALSGMGYTREQAKAAVMAVAEKDASTEGLLRAALRQLSSR